jgi:hypothetical protein
MNPSELNLFFEPKDRLRMTVGEDRSFPTVKPAWAAPLSHPERYLALLDGKGDEIVTIPNPSDLPPASKKAVDDELYRRYLTADIARVVHAKTEFGATYWTVDTNRGRRDFVTQNLQENAQWLSPVHIMLIDVDGNRFEITDKTALDAKSQEFIAAIL